MRLCLTVALVIPLAFSFAEGLLSGSALERIDEVLERAPKPDNLRDMEIYQKNQRSLDWNGYDKFRPGDAMMAKSDQNEDYEENVENDKPLNLYSVPHQIPVVVERVVAVPVVIPHQGWPWPSDASNQGKS